MPPAAPVQMEVPGKRPRPVPYTSSIIVIMPRIYMIINIIIRIVIIPVFRAVRIIFGIGTGGQAGTQSSNRDTRQKLDESTSVH